MAQIIVVGAGLAGLSAAYELVRAGYDVQVFEARDRVGGRVCTVQLGAGQYGDLGAEFVDDNHTAAIALADQFDLKLDPACQFPDDIYWFIDGIVRNRASLTVEQGNAIDNLYSKLASLLEAQTDPRETLEEWLDTARIAPFARWIARLQAQALFATDSDLIGVGFFGQFGGAGRGNMRVRGGSSRLADALAERLGERIHTGAIVRRIQQTDDTVTVGIETNGLVEVAADSVILAMPWSVLRHIPLEAPLTTAQREAIFALPYGGVVKTLVQYPSRFWSQSNLGIVLFEGEYQAIWEPTFAQAGTNKILSCFSGGSPSLLLGQQASHKAQQTVRTIFPDAPEAIACLSYDWSADEWARGAYCYFGPGDLNRFNPSLTLPAGRVFFAGEHTAPVEYRGYMEGAIRSGQRAAQQVCTAMGK
jgi:monoamine oxidase